MICALTRSEVTHWISLQLWQLKCIGYGWVRQQKPLRISMPECKTMAPVGGEEAEMISRTFARSGSLEYT
jgi:hypothetical protein